MSGPDSRRIAQGPDARRRRALAHGVALTLGGLGAALGGRGALAAGQAAAPADAARAAGGVPHRIVVMSWEIGEMLLSLGVVPVGISLPDWYRTGIVAPPLPAGVSDIGLLYQPNFEVLLELKPDLFLITTGHAAARQWFERIAPTLTLGMYRNAADPFRALCGEMQTLGARLARADRATALIDETGRTLDAVRASLGGAPARTARPVLVADFADDRHLRVYGSGSLFDQMLTRIGLTNAANPRGGPAWPTDSGYATVPMQRLVEVRDASLLIVGGVSAAQRVGLESNAIWQALPAVREKRIAPLPVIAPYGGLVSMQRFVRAVDAALSRIDAGGGGVA